MITLSGVISAADLISNFDEDLSEIDTANATITSQKPWQINADVRDLTTSLSVAQRYYDFTMPDDAELVGMGVSFWNPDATSRSCTMTLKAISEAQSQVSKMIPGGSVSVSATGSSASEFNSTGSLRDVAGSGVIFLVKGVTYRLEFTRTDANAGVIDRAYGFLLFQSRTRFT